MEAANTQQFSLSEWISTRNEQHFVHNYHRSPVNFLHKGQWRGALMFSLIYAQINDWVNHREAGDLRRHHAHYDFIAINQLTFTPFRMRVYAYVYEFDMRRKTAKVLVYSLLYQSISWAMLETSWERFKHSSISVTRFYHFEFVQRLLKGLIKSSPRHSG